MAQPAKPLDRFVGRVYRRLWLVRTAEAAGIGLLAGCGMGVVLLAILLYRNQPGLGLALAILPLGAIGGVIWSILRPPGKLAAASRADRQFDLSDLLATAWMLQHGQMSTDTACAQAVLAMAAHRVAGISPSAVLLRQLGIRAWGGIGLAMALLLTMGLLSANPVDSQASGLTSASLLRAAASPAVRPANANQIAALGAAGDHSAMAADPSDQDDRAVEGASDNAMAASAGKTAGNDDGDANASDPTGSGKGAGRSQANKSGQTLAAAGNANTTGGAAPAGGGASAGPGAGAGAGKGAAGSAVGASPASVAAPPPWSTPLWPAAAQAAGAAINSGQVPPAYQDLVRAYFDRN